MDLQERATIYDQRDRLSDVVGRLSRFWNKPIQCLRVGCEALIRFENGRGVSVVRGQITQQSSGELKYAVFVVGNKVCDPGRGCVSRGSAQSFEIHFLTGDRLDDVWTRDEHVTAAASHHHEVRQPRRVHRAPRAGTKHEADLRDDTTCLGVAPEEVTEASETPDSFLNAGTNGIEQRDDRQPGRGGRIQQLSHLLSLDLGERSSEHREVLGEHSDAAPLNQAEPSHHAVAAMTLLLQPESAVPVLDIGGDLLERPRVENAFNSFSRGELAPGMLRVDPFLAAAQPEGGTLRSKRVVRILAGLTFGGGSGAGPFGLRVWCHPVVVKGRLVVRRRFGCVGGLPGQRHWKGPGHDGAFELSGLWC